MKTVVIEKCSLDRPGSTFRASFRHAPDEQAVGQTIAEAVGGLFFAHTGTFMEGVWEDQVSGRSAESAGREVVFVYAGTMSAAEAGSHLVASPECYGIEIVSLMPSDE